MSDVLQRYPKKGASAFGHFSLLGDNYWADPSNHTSFEVFARDGKLMLAIADGSVNGVPWDFTFFHSTNDAEMLRQFDREADQYVKQHSGQKIPDAAKKP